MSIVVKVTEIDDAPYTHEAVVLVLGRTLPMGEGRGKGQSAYAAERIAASNAGFFPGQYTVIRE